MGKGDLPRSFVAAPQRGARSPCTCRDRLSLDRSREQPQGPPHHRPVRGETASGRHGKWARARAEIRVKQWFGFVPDFIITLDAEYCRACGSPVFTIRGHNVEEFIGVVRRYGADAAGIRAI
ncbi:putative metallopeptidase [Sinorhizobium medicae]